MSPPRLACTVRGCAQPLRLSGRTWSCAAGHSFDVARAGYVNLLQPQDRRSREPGDSADAVAARAALLESGIGVAAIEHIAGLVQSLPPGSTVVDLGSGTGALIGAMISRARVEAIGIDLSVTAIERAARRHPTAAWVVANADRWLPLVDASVMLITSLNARRHPVECARVLHHDGRLVVAVPAVDDLRELREFVGGQHVERDRAEGVINEHESAFTLMRRETIRGHHHLDRQQLVQLLRATYRGERRSAAPRVEQLDTLAVTMATDVMTFRRR